jgi:hypothetical protein
MEAAVQAIEKFPMISLWELEIISRLLNRNCDDDVSDDLNDALDSVCRAIKTIENREYTPSQQTYMREQEAR